ncbi:MAG: hypothetical protein ACJAS4_000683 [Bacteriovoracaceae bacterium]|jgi:hypothetical protein
MKFLVICLFLITNAYADSIKVRVNPENPLINETFNVDFIIDTKEEGEPIISFNPLGVDVVSRSEVGTSTRMTIINGERTIERSLSVTYELMPSKSGTIFLRDISVEINGNVIKHKTVRISVLKKAKETKKIFVKAEVSKNKVYVGESIVVRYYLYNRADIPLAGTDIRKFPKLDKFLKRFHQEPMSLERVQFDGKMYSRRIMYTAQLFGEKPGVYKIDPINMKVSYSRRGNPFGGFGGFNLQIGRPQSTTISSTPVEIEVISLPAEGMKPHFSGLVGDHSFNLKVNKNKFIANEPIELTLNIEGEGALELFEAPILLSHENIEEFEKTNDLAIKKNFTAQKVIDYTYLGRGDVNLENIEVPISYFDPESETYKTKKLKIGNIKVAGIGQQNTRQFTKNEPKVKPSTLPVPSIQVKPYEFKPIFKLANTFIYGIKEIFIATSFLLFLFTGFLGIKYFKSKVPKELSVFDTIYKKGVNYSNLYKVLNLTGNEGQMENIVNSLNVSEPAKQYFKNLVESFNDDFSTSKSDKVVRIEKRYFKELENMLNNQVND